MKLFKFLLNFLSLAYKKKVFKNYFYSFGGIDALVCRIFNTQKKGIYTLKEARTIMNAIDFLNSDK